MASIHYRDDFSVSITLIPLNGVAIKSEFVHDVLFRTTHNSVAKCTVEDNSLVTVDATHLTAFLDGHRLLPGHLKAAIHYQLPNSDFGDGYQDLYQAVDTDVDLVKGEGDTTDVDFALTIGVDTAGFASRLEDLDEQVSRNTSDIASNKSALDGKQDKLVDSSTTTIINNNSVNIEIITDKEINQLF